MKPRPDRARFCFVPGATGARRIGVFRGCGTHAKGAVKGKIMDFSDPSDIATMAELRAQIDRIDGELLRLLAFRQRHIDRAIDLKPGEGIAARAESRIDDVLSKVRDGAASAGFDPDLAERLWREMIETFIAREEAQIGTGGDRT